VYCTIAQVFAAQYTMRGSDAVVYYKAAEKLVIVNYCVVSGSQLFELYLDACFDIGA